MVRTPLIGPTGCVFHNFTFFYTVYLIPIEASLRAFVSSSDPIAAALEKRHVSPQNHFGEGGGGTEWHIVGLFSCVTVGVKITIGSTNTYIQNTNKCVMSTLDPWSTV